MMHEAADDLDVCQICFYRAIDTVLVPCGHQALCTRCSAMISICPFCRDPIKSRVQVTEPAERTPAPCFRKYGQ